MCSSPLQGWLAQYLTQNRALKKCLWSKWVNYLTWVPELAPCVTSYCCGLGRDDDGDTNGGTGGWNWVRMFLIFYLVVFMDWALKTGKKNVLTVKGKGFRRKELHCSGWQRQDEFEGPGSIWLRRENSGRLGAVGGSQRGKELPGILWRREFGKDKCLTGDVYIFLILLRVVLCKFSPFHNCQLIHIAH